MTVFFPVPMYTRASISKRNVGDACLKWIDEQGPHQTLHQISAITYNHASDTFTIEGIKFGSALTFKWSATAEVIVRGPHSADLMFDWNGI